MPDITGITMRQPIITSYYTYRKRRPNVGLTHYLWRKGPHPLPAMATAMSYFDYCQTFKVKLARRPERYKWRMV